MKQMTLTMKECIESIQDLCKWAVKKRILVCTHTGIMIGTIVKIENNLLFIRLDNATKIKLNGKSSHIIGEGINRKRKTAIPDEELHLWKKELRLFLTDQ